MALSAFGFCPIDMGGCYGMGINCLPLSFYLKVLFEYAKLFTNNSKEIDPQIFTTILIKIFAETISFFRVDNKFSRIIILTKTRTDESFF